MKRSDELRLSCLSTRAFCVLDAQGIHTLGDLVREIELRGPRRVTIERKNCGKVTEREIAKFLSDVGFVFPDWRIFQ